MRWVWLTPLLTIPVVGVPLAIVLSNGSSVLTWRFLQGGPPPDRLVVIPWHSPSAALIWIFAATVPLQMAHFMSPIAATWLNRDFRPTLLRQKGRYIWVPLGFLAVTAAIGAATQLGWTDYDLHHPHQIWRVTGLDNPFPLLFWAYWAWNAWHFARQNFGVMLLCRFSRSLAWGVGFGGTMFAMVGLPYVADMLGARFITMLAMTGLISVGHWVIELGLTARIATRRWLLRVLFLVALLVTGLVGFVWTEPTPYGPMLFILPWLTGALFGLDFTHFWYDQFIYRERLIKETLR